jgi:hypothetical protein
MAYEKWHTTNIDVERENNAGVAIEVLVCGAYTLKERSSTYQSKHYIPLTVSASPNVLL